MNERKQQIAKLAAELKHLKKVDRCPHEPKPGIGGVIQRLRQNKGLSVSQLAYASGVSKGLISRIETSENPNVELKTLERIAKALGIRLSQIIATVELENWRDI